MSVRAFTFGKNWRRFLKSYTTERQTQAQQALLKFLKMPDLKGKTFLDIGSGSGIHSAAAWLLGAARVVSFDFDPDSVAATRELRARFGAPDNWVVLQGSVLDEGFMQSLGAFDIVYSWGVLHHTGDQWTALTKALERLHADSRLYIALYSKEAMQPNWRHWEAIKRRYNAASWVEKRCMELNYIWEWQLGKDWRQIGTLIHKVRSYPRERGMEFMTDVRDWLGGWPTEFASVPEVVDFVRERTGFDLVNLTAGESNTEFLFVSPNKAERRGLAPVDLIAHPFGLHRLHEANLKDKGPIWIFGCGRAGQLIHGYLKKQNIQIAGFIDIQPSASSFEGVPVLSFEKFAASQPTTAEVVIASSYVKENARRLAARGFMHIYDGFLLAKTLP